MTLLPSAVSLVVDWATSNTNLAAIHGGRVGTRLNDALPAIRIQRVGGPPREQWRDEPVLQIECWASTEVLAEKLARTVVDELPTIRQIASTGRIYSYTIESGPFFSADDSYLSANSRYILSVHLLITKL